jgi:N utilization substance protein B
MTRSAAREAALQLLYESMLGGEGGLETKTGLLELDPEDVEMSYVDAIVTGVLQAESALDELIRPQLRDWTLERLERVDLAILRLAVFEIRHRPDIPAPVSIREAVDLAHRFSTPEAASFINGVLGSLYRQQGGTECPQP